MTYISRRNRATTIIIYAAIVFFAIMILTLFHPCLAKEIDKLIDLVRI